MAAAVWEGGGARGFGGVKKRRRRRKEERDLPSPPTRACEREATPYT